MPTFIDVRMAPCCRVMRRYRPFRRRIDQARLRQHQHPPEHHSRLLRDRHHSRRQDPLRCPQPRHPLENQPENQPIINLRRPLRDPPRTLRMTQLSLPPRSPPKRPTPNRQSHPLLVRLQHPRNIRPIIQRILPLVHRPMHQRNRQPTLRLQHPRDIRPILQQILPLVRQPTHPHNLQPTLRRSLQPTHPLRLQQHHQLCLQLLVQPFRQLLVQQYLRLLHPRMLPLYLQPFHQPTVRPLLRQFHPRTVQLVHQHFRRHQIRQTNLRLIPPQIRLEIPLSQLSRQPQIRLSIQPRFFQPQKHRLRIQPWIPPHSCQPRSFPRLLHRRCSVLLRSLSMRRKYIMRHLRKTLQLWLERSWLTLW
mmetsp:Transcript_31304/g.50751  ORF Transcript_31304/g.50751 Transcript_31304/m.50751 type:complete len:362 (-) Transcript_31304:237-1322(-)